MTNMNVFKNHWSGYGNKNNETIKTVPGQTNETMQAEGWSIQEPEDDDSLEVIKGRHDVHMKKTKKSKPKKVNNEDDSKADYDLYDAELARGFNGHQYDHFWSDNFPPEDPHFMDVQLSKYGCSCCVGPCCNTERKKNWRSFFLSCTFWLSLLELILFLVEVAMGGLTVPSAGPGLQFFFSLFSADRAAVLALGALYLPNIYCNYQVFRYVTVCLLHASVPHILSNMSFQLTFMLSRERYWGRVRMLSMFVVCGIGASVWSLAIMPMSLSVGASGSLFGIFGGFLVDVVRMWGRMSSSLRCQYGIMIITQIVAAVLMGFLIPFINIWAHLGGCVTGVLFGMVILQRKWFIRIIGIVLLLIMMAIPTVITYLYKVPVCPVQ